MDIFMNMLRYFYCLNWNLLPVTRLRTFSVAKDNIRIISNVSNDVHYWSSFLKIVCLVRKRKMSQCSRWLLLCDQNDIFNLFHKICINIGFTILCAGWIEQPLSFANMCSSFVGAGRGSQVVLQPPPRPTLHRSDAEDGGGANFQLNLKTFKADPKIHSNILILLICL